MRIVPRRIEGPARLPPSRAHTLVGYALAALSGNGSVQGPLDSPEVRHELDLLSRLGFLVGHFPGESRVGGVLRPSPRPFPPVRSSGTLAMVVAVLSTGAQPIALLPAAPASHGAVVHSIHSVLRQFSSVPDDGWSVRGPARARGAISATTDEALAAALLIASAGRFACTIETQALHEHPYGLAQAATEQLGARGVHLDVGQSAVQVAANQRISQRSLAVPVDAGVAAFLRLAATTTKGNVELPAGTDPSPDHREVLTKAASAQDPLRVAIAWRPDAVAARAVQPGTHRIEWPEEPRREALTAALRSMGLRIEVSEAALTVEGGIPKGISWQGFYDEGIARAVTALALAADGESDLSLEGHNALEASVAALAVAETP